MHRHRAFAHQSPRFDICGQFGVLVWLRALFEWRKPCFSAHSSDDIKFINSVQYCCSAPLARPCGNQLHAILYWCNKLLYNATFAHALDVIALKILVFASTARMAPPPDPSQKVSKMRCKHAYKNGNIHIF